MSQEVFYRKYRPQAFDEVYDQKAIKQTLQNAILNDKLAHAYLFTGPRGTGKTTMARIFAKAINCQNRKSNQFEPCNKCESCNSVNNGSSFDVIEFDAATNTGINEIRALQDNSAIKPTTGKYKIYIIDESHQLSKSACSALLKILEEPPEYIIFILATTDPEKMLKTILSRVQRFDFKKINLEDIVKKLEAILKKEKISYELPALHLIAKESEGGLRDAESLLNQLTTLNDKITLLSAEEMVGGIGQNKLSMFVDLMVDKNLKAVFEFINDLDENGYNLEEFYKQLLGYMQNLLTIKVSEDLASILKKDMSDDLIENIKNQAKKVDIKFIQNGLEAMIKNQDYFGSVTNPKLPLELTILEIIPIQE